jgi:glycosyltransferase involved in cell wall biosynthesis
MKYRTLVRVNSTGVLMFFEDLIPKQRWPARFRTFEFAARVSSHVAKVELYAQHDIFVLPSLVEGMASALAVITTESSGMTDLVEDGHDGLLTIPGDADSLTVAIGTLCGNSQLRHKLGCAAQEKMKRFTWKLSALRHEAVFRRAMGVKPVPKLPESHETDIDGAPYSGKVVLN